MSLLDNIKKDIKKSAASQGKMFYLKPESKGRIRFITPFEKGITVIMHDDFQNSINSICYEHVGKDCPNEIHENDSVRTRENYAWCVYDYDAKEVKILMYAANTFTPVPSLASFYGSYKTITDRDYVIERNQKGKGYQVIPQDKAVFRNKKAKPYPEKKMLKFIYDANHLEEDDISDDDDNNEEIDYSSMKSKELYDLCIEREIDAETRKKPDYYISLLEAFDEEQGSDDDWGDEPSDDDWGDEPKDDNDWGDEAEAEVDYSKYSAKELYDMCIEKEIDVPSRKKEAFYIEKLEEDDVPW